VGVKVGYSDGQAELLGNKQAGVEPKGRDDQGVGVGTGALALGA